MKNINLKATVTTSGSFTKDIDITVSIDDILRVAIERIELLEGYEYVEKISFIDDDNKKHEPKLPSEKCYDCGSPRRITPKRVIETPCPNCGDECNF